MVPLTAAAVGVILARRAVGYGPAVPVRAVVFDVGGVLVDEQRIWSRWADHLDVPRFELFAVLGAVVERGGEHRDVLELLRPGFDVDAAMRAEPDRLGAFDGDDLYADVRACLARVADAGLVCGIAGNQPGRAREVLETLELPVEFVGVSEEWGVAKPEPGFFDRVARAAGCSAHDVAYVGDRLDHDVAPAHAAGMTAVLVGRGPWGRIHASRPDAAEPDAVVDSLDELPGVLLDGW